MTTQQLEPLSQRLTLSPQEFAEATGLSLTTVRAAIRRGELAHARLGRRVLIPMAALRELANGSLSGA